MQAIRFVAKVDDRVAAAWPHLRPMLGRRVELIALETEASEEMNEQGITLDEFLATRPEWPKGRPALTLQQIEEAIAKGAINGADL